MAEEPSPSQPREGIFLPDIEKVSKAWLAKVDGLTAQFVEQSEQWQVKVESLTTLIETLVAELQDLQGFTVRVERSSDAV